MGGFTFYMVQARKYAGEWVTQKVGGYGGDPEEFGTRQAAEAHARTLQKESTYHEARVLKVETIASYFPGSRNEHDSLKE